MREGEEEGVGFGRGKTIRGNDSSKVAKVGDVLVGEIEAKVTFGISSSG